MMVQRAWKGTPALHQGLWWGAGGDSPLHPARLHSQMEAQWALQKVSGHLAEVQCRPSSPQDPSLDSEMLTLGVGGWQAYTQIKCKGPDRQADPDSQE